MVGLILVSLICFLSKFFYSFSRSTHNCISSTSAGNKKHAPRKRNRKPSSQSSTNWGSPRATRSRSRPKKKVEGSTNDNAITIDSSSDESSADDMEIDGCSMPPKEFKDDELIHEV